MMSATQSLFPQKQSLHSRKQSHQMPEISKIKLGNDNAQGILGNLGKKEIGFEFKMALKKQWLLSKDKVSNKPKGLIAKNALIDMKKKQRYPKSNLETRKDSVSEISPQYKTFDHKASASQTIDQVISYNDPNKLGLPPLKSPINKSPKSINHSFNMDLMKKDTQKYQSLQASSRRPLNQIQYKKPKIALQ